MERISEVVRIASEFARISLLLLAAGSHLGSIYRDIRLDQLYHARSTVKDGAALRPIEFDLSVEGSSKPMHPIARDEVYRIGYEAIRNARNHSGAARPRVNLSYLHDRVVRMKDNGNGFESAAVNTEPMQADFGLIGMYERGAGIHGKLTIFSSPGRGTRVELIVPRSIAFLDRGRPRKRPNWKSLWP